MAGFETPPARRSVRWNLLYDDESSGLLEIGGCQLVEIDTTGDAFAEGIASVPICCTTLTVVEACGLETERKRANQLTRRIVNGDRYQTVFGELIGYPRLRVKWVPVVLQQEVLCRLTDVIKPDRQNCVCEVLRGHFDTENL